MAEQVVYFKTADGTLFDTLAAAEQHERVNELCEGLEAFQDYDSFDKYAAAKWLLENYEITKRGTGNDA